MGKTNVTMEPLPDYGYLMTLGEFIEACRTGSFIDYDGIGNYATETQVSNVEVSPSDVVQGNVDARWTHIVWFNR